MGACKKVDSSVDCHADKNQRQRCEALARKQVLVKARKTSEAVRA